jgi:hypothetical protein
VELGMTDATTVDLEREANAAAADAAAEARREVLERAEPAEPAATPRAPAKVREKPKRPEWVQFGVSVWLTDLNSTEFGIYKRSRNRAKSRQFTTDMDIFAEVIEKGERTGLIGYREDQWKNTDRMNKRLVLKMFSASLNWRATMDLMLGRSLQQTIGARGFPVTSFSINTNDHDQIVYLERSANQWTGLPENFSFFLLEDNGEIEFFRIRQKFIRLGMDYIVYNERDEKVAILDGAFFTITGRWKCWVRSDYKDRRLHTTLKLFCAMLLFNRKAKRHLKLLYKDVIAGRYSPSLERLEADLYMNPRRVR